MALETIVALFRSPAEAERAQRDLVADGMPATDMSIRCRSNLGEWGASASSGSQGFFDWLFGSRVPDTAWQSYRSFVQERDGAVLSIRADSAAYDGVERTLDRHELVRLDEIGPGRAGAAPATAAAPAAPARAAPGAGAQETVIPTAREELKVGKRQVEDAQSYRLRRYVVEHPVEEQVQLRDETVTVERRQPAQRAADGRSFEEKTVELRERREEPVVSKEVRPGEEVVVRKEARDRTETVRDTARETKVDVDRAAAGNKPDKPSPGRR